MSDFLFDALGMGEVSDTPGDVPIGTWDGVIQQSNLVIKEGNDQYPDPSLAHAITFKVESGDQHNGSKRTQWFNLGINPVKADGTPATNVNEIATFTGTMSQKAKEYYKQMWVKLGHPGPRKDVEVLNNTPVTFRVYENNGRKNAVVESLRTASADGPVSTGFDSAGPMPF